MVRTMVIRHLNVDVLCLEVAKQAVIAGRQVFACKSENRWGELAETYAILREEDHISAEDSWSGG